MFTGIISNQAKVIKKEKHGAQVRFVFRFIHKEKNRPVPGESIAVNGVCLTAVKIGRDFFEAVAVRETLEATTLSSLETGSKVNTERSLKMGDSLGGHFVTGHIDGCGRILKIEKSGKNYSFWIQAPPALKPYLAVKGSVGVDGISLTVQAVKGLSFKVAVIPYTFSHTTLGTKKAGSEVNLEADLVARYLNVLSSSLSPRKSLIGGARLDSRFKHAGMTKKILKKQGF